MVTTTYKLSSQEEEVEEAFLLLLFLTAGRSFMIIGSVFFMRALITHIFWKGSVVEHRQSRSFLECTEVMFCCRG